MHDRFGEPLTRCLRVGFAQAFRAMGGPDGGWSIRFTLEMEQQTAVCLDHNLHSLGAERFLSYPLRRVLAGFPGRKFVP